MAQILGSFFFKMVSTNYFTVFPESFVQAVFLGSVKFSLTRFSFLWYGHNISVIYMNTK